HVNGGDWGLAGVLHALVRTVARAVEGAHSFSSLRRSSPSTGNAPMSEIRSTHTPVRAIGLGDLLHGSSVTHSGCSPPKTTPFTPGSAVSTYRRRPRPAPHRLHPYV